jgi:hypothetical protein
MLVYGDPKFEGRLQALCARLCGLANQALAHQDNLDRLRMLLIFCGQVEQGAHDTLAQSLAADEAEPFITQFHQATAHAAEAFYSIAWRQRVALPPPVIDTGTALRNLLHTLDNLHNAPNMTLTIKLPEGFSLYALYPEQYLVAAAQWLAAHSLQRSQGAVVVGIRSIGTTLAAVVSTALRAGGRQVHSFTVRPAGHPYHREVNLSGMALEPNDFGLIVDEGPGISGSSMAATAGALVGAGMDRRNIAFFPGHPHAPGGAGSEEVQAWWQTTPRYVAGTKELVFNGVPLQDALAAILPEAVMHREDFSSGLWRRHLYPDSSVWPALCTAFERIKYRYTLQSGKRVLFKFLGLASLSPDLTSTAESAAALLRERATQGLASPLLGVAYGFVAMEWVEGTPIHFGSPSSDPPSDPPSEMIDTLGEYIAQVAGTPMSDDEARLAVERLTEMLVVNTQEALGEAAAKRAQRYSLSTMCRHDAYGDGHMQPHEWIETQDNQLFKVDSVGHACDHTLIGRQSVVWDIAGAIVEWGFDGKAMARLLKAFEAAGGTSLDSDSLDFYRVAYLAFRVGQCSLAAQVHDPDEHDRLLRSYAVYRQQLAEFLDITRY